MRTEGPAEASPNAGLEINTLPGASGLCVVNLAHGMAAALVGKHFSALGAPVTSVGELEADPFTRHYPAYRFWRGRELRIEVDELPAALDRADVVIIGGEDHPDLADVTYFDDLSVRYPCAVVLDLRASIPGSTAAGPAVDLLVQSRTGMTWEHYTERPIAFGVPFPTYGQVLTGLVGTWAALVERQRSGSGQVVTASLQQGAGMFMAPFWLEASESDPEFAKVAPKDANHLVFECADGTFVQMVLGVPQAIVKLYRALGIDLPADPNDRGLPKPGAGPGKYFGDTDLYAPYVKKFTRDQVITNCVREGIPVAPVLEPGEIWSHPQAAVTRMIEEFDGHRTAGLPITLAGAHHTDDTVGPEPDSRGTDPDGPPLKGLRLFDAGSFLAGPYVSKILADLGADVVKIEPIGGEPLRGIARTFQIICAGKRILPLDVKSEFGARVVARIVETSDAVNYNYRPGVAERMGLAPRQVRAVNPALITLNTTGFGPSGPMSQDPAFDMVVQALAGLEVRGGGVGNIPQWYRLPYIDFVSASYGAVAILIAYWERQESGLSLDLATSLLDAALFMTSDLVERPDGSFLSSPMLDHEQLGFHPAERIYRTSDGWVAVVARGEGAAAGLVAALGLESVLVGPLSSWDDKARDLIAAQLLGSPTDVALDILTRHGVWAEDCRKDGLRLLKEDPATRAAGLLVERCDATYGTVVGPTGPLVSFSRSTCVTSSLLGASPLGADTRDVLNDLGFDDQEIEQAFADGVVR